ncbi:MAG: DUF1492 domain-containing protein [Ruminiclostridium sp.]|nr:DUF1492 domain-containing protein [Ruminiclostridium sp.]
MNVKRLLESHKELDDRINLDLEELAQLRALAENVTRHFTLTPGGKGGSSDKTGIYAAKIADLERKIDREIDRLVEIKDYIKSVISSLENEAERLVLWRRYILHMSAEEIAERLCYSHRHVTRLLKSAISKLETIYADKEDIA